MEQIREIEILNLNAVKFYLDLAEKRLGDDLETKKQFEQKAFVLLSGYITASIALFSLAEKFKSESLFFNLTAILFCMGILPLFFSLKSSAYGALGKNPKDWLQSIDYLAVVDEKVPHMYAYTLWGFVKKINTSTVSNSKKAFYLNIAVLLGMSSVLPFLFKVLFLQPHHLLLKVLEGFLGLF